MGITTGALSTFSIGTTTDIDTSSSSAAITDFQNDTFQDVGEVSSVASFGNQFNEVTFTALGDSRTRKFKGSQDAGTIEVQAAFDSGDSGQTAMDDAHDDDSNDTYNFRVVLNDAETSGGSGTAFYFFGKVMNRQVGDISNDNITQVTYTVAIDSDIFQEDAT